MHCNFIYQFTVSPPNPRLFRFYARISLEIVRRVGSALRGLHDELKVQEQAQEHSAKNKSRKESKMIKKCSRRKIELKLNMKRNYLINEVRSVKLINLFFLIIVKRKQSFKVFVVSR